MAVLVLPTVAEAQKHDWDDLHDPDDLYHSPKWLRMEEQIGIARPFHVLSVPEGSPAAAAATWGLVVDESAFWPFMRIDTVLSDLLDDRQVPQTAEVKEALGALMPSAYLGALRGGTNRLQIRPGLDPAAARAAATEVLDGVEAMAAGEGLRSAAFFYLPPEEELLRQVLRDRGYAEFGPLINVSVLTITGDTFADYLRRFGKRRRDSIRWERRNIGRAGVQISVEDLSPGLIEEMLPLEAQLYRKYGHASHPTEMARQLHQMVLPAYGRAARVITARADGGLRGYAAFIQVNQTLYSRDTGYDYGWEPKLPLYFEVLFYSAIELAMRSGAAQINYSYASDAPKASRGCELRPRLGYVKALDKDAALSLERLAALVRDAGGC